MGWIADDLWQKATIPKWKLTVLRLLFPKRSAVRLDGRTYFLRIRRDS